MTVNPIKPCEICKANGYFSHKFQAVLCDRHFFERNGKLKAPAVADKAQPQGDQL